MSRYVAVLALSIAFVPLCVASASAQPAKSHKSSLVAKVPAEKVLATGIDSHTRINGAKHRHRAGKSLSISISGALWELRSQYLGGDSSYELKVKASDPKRGITRVWLENENTGVLGSREVECDHSRGVSPSHVSTHKKSGCPRSLLLTMDISTDTFPEGRNAIAVKATNAAGVTKETTLTVFVDRTPPTIPENAELLFYDATSKVAVIGWDEGSDPQLQDGSPGSGPAGYEYRSQVDGGDWSDWIPSASPEVELADTPNSATVNFDVRATDAVGNVSDIGTGFMSTDDLFEPGLQVSVDGADYSVEPMLTVSESNRAVDLALADARLLALVGDRPYSVSKPEVWTKASGALIGAVVSLNFTESAGTLSGLWPSIAYDESDTDESDTAYASYQSYLARYTATTVPGLYVSVDLNCEQVVSIEPGGPAEIDPDSVSIKGKPRRPACQSAQTAGAFRSTKNNIIGASAAVRSVAANRTVQASGAQRSWNRSVRIIRIGSDAFYNYDFHNMDSLSARNTDNPVNLIFWGDVWEEDIMTFYTWGAGATSIVGSKQYGYAKEGPDSPWDWSSSHGYKDRITCGTTNHFRVYQNEYPGYNDYWGAFLFGTAHQDKADIPAVNLGFKKWRRCGAAPTYGWQELAERNVADEATRKFGSHAVERNKLYFKNAERRHWEGNRRQYYRWSNGRATKIRVCLDQNGWMTTCPNDDIPME